MPNSIAAIMDAPFAMSIDNRTAKLALGHYSPLFHLVMKIPSFMLLLTMAGFATLVAQDQKTTGYSDQLFLLLLSPENPLTTKDGAAVVLLISVLLVIIKG